MLDRVRTVVCVSTLALLGILIAPRAWAQLPIGATTVGIEAGLPLVFGVDVSHRVSPRVRVGLAVGRLSGLTVLRAEGRWLLRDEIPERFVVSLVAGAEQYFLEDAGQDATPLGVHAAIGLDYYLLSPVSIGARIGALHTFGSSNSGNVRVFSVENGYDSGIFNVGVRYHF